MAVPETNVAPELREIPGRELILVGRVRHTQGRRGEVAAEILTDFPERFAAGAKFLLVKGTTAPREYVVEEAWFHKGQVILKFAGVGSISEAELLRGYDVLIPSAERKELPAGTFYLGDLIDCRVMEGEREIGRVVDWEDTGGGILLHVGPGDKPTVGPTVGPAAGNEILIPFAMEICREIDVAGRVIQVRLPDGLLDLNSVQGKVQGQSTPLLRSSAGSGTNDD